MTYIGRSHVKAAYKGSFTDRLPVYSITSLINAKVAGITMKKYITDRKECAKAVVASYERFQGDVVTMMADLVMEGEGCGSKVGVTEDDLGDITKHVVEDKKDLLK